MIVVIILLVVATATSGVIFKPGAWYETLRKPDWTPPNRAFPIVWTALYAMIAVAGWLVWREAGLGLSMLLWFAQLLANFLWSWLFFGLRRMDLGFADIVILWLLIAAFIVAVWPVSVWAALLFVPYLAWVTLAGLLNLSIWRLNWNGGDRI